MMPLLTARPGLGPGQLPHSIIRLAGENPLSGGYVRTDAGTRVGRFMLSAPLAPWCSGPFLLSTRALRCVGDDLCTVCG